MGKKAPLQVEVSFSRVSAPKPAKKMRGVSSDSVTNRNMSAPRNKVTNATRSPLEVAKPSKAASNLKSGPVQRLNMGSTKEELPMTFKGFPKNRFKGRYDPNTPQ